MNEKVSEQRTPAWFEARLGRFTSSEIVNLFVEPRNKKDKEAGLWSDTAKSYIYKKACETIYGYSEKFVGNDATQWGNTHEHNAKKRYEQITGNIVDDCGFFEYNKDTGGSPDGLIRLDVNDAEFGVAEIKCPFKMNIHIDNVMILNDQKDLLKHRKTYYYQIQHQMFCTGATWGNFISYDPRLERREYFNENCLHVLLVEKDTILHEQFDYKIQLAVEYRNKIVERFLNDQYKKNGE